MLRFAYLVEDAELLDRSALHNVETCDLLHLRPRPRAPIDHWGRNAHRSQVVSRGEAAGLAGLVPGGVERDVCLWG